MASEHLRCWPETSLLERFAWQRQHSAAHGRSSARSEVNVTDTKRENCSAVQLHLCSQLMLGLKGRLSEKRFATLLSCGRCKKSNQCCRWSSSSPKKSSSDLWTRKTWLTSEARGTSVSQSRWQANRRPRRRLYLHHFRRHPRRRRRQGRHP